LSRAIERSRSPSSARAITGTFTCYRICSSSSPPFLGDLQWFHSMPKQIREALHGHPEMEKRKDLTRYVVHGTAASEDLRRESPVFSATHALRSRTLLEPIRPIQHVFYQGFMGAPASSQHSNFDCLHDIRSYLQALP
jgi:hypothetical protein